jgi:hypothetical protein
MTPDQAIDRLCEAIRESFAPDVEIEFNTGLGGIADSVDFVNVVASVGEDQLNYDRADLVKLIRPAEVEPCEGAHTYKGQIGGYKYRVMLCPSL